MAPKADKAKVEQKKKAVEEKTFGLKNKNKSAKVQKFVQEQVKQVTQKSAKEARLAEPSVKDKKKAAEEKEKELAALFAVAIKQPKVPLGVDPKSIVCEFFRHGQCAKGFKCKFSHDLGVERRGAKIDLFTDQREIGGADEEGMEDWDQEQLEKVVKEKHGKEEPANKTDIVCKFFIDAVEKRQYGWFWKCPNGTECKYRHALPPGYILKSQMKELLEEEARNKRDVAEEIEEERQKVEARTPITEAVFREWRSRKEAEKRQRDADQEAERRRKGLLNGREIFMQEGFIAEDDAGAADDYDREDNEEEAIRKMIREADEAAAAARANRAFEEGNGAGPSGSNGHHHVDGADGAGPSTSGAGPSGSGAGPSTSGVATTLQLREDEAALFLDDDDDGDDDDEGEDDEDDDEDDEDLDGLEASVRQTHLGEDGGA